ncbi:MAG: hypothetical protein J1F68_01390 [Clostridiales bacterium]|nr:hypothetical protein [Clostridiales bacterium]
MMETIISSLISAIVAALIAALTTIFVERRKEKNRKSEQQEQNSKYAFENRPEYKIVDYKDYTSRTGYGIKQKCDIDIFMTSIVDVEVQDRVEAFYCEKDFNQSEWCCVIYTFQNVGKTDVSVTDIICNHKRTYVIFQSDFASGYLSHKCLNYSESSDKKVRVGETITIKICYHKDHIIRSAISANLSIGLVDSNGQCWKQSLFAPHNKIYDSFRVPYGRYHSDLRTDDAEECFKDPYKW